MEIHSKITIFQRRIEECSAVKLKIKVTCGDLILSKARGRILHVATRGGSGITTHHELPATTRRITPNDERHLREHKALH